MKKALNLNFKFRVESPLRPATMGHHKLFQLAATLPVFQIDDLKREAETHFQETIGADLLHELRRMSTRIHEETFELDEPARQRILKHIGRNELISLLESRNQQDTFCAHLLTYLKGKAKPLSQQNKEQLVHTLRLSRWFVRSKLGLPSEAEVLNVLQELEMLEPFQKLTQQFKGRKKELEQLADYVDWLPKSSFLSKSRQLARNIIRWHEKPPLVLSGIGGIGKSTIIARFILDNITYKTKGKLPFVYFDFDKPGISLSAPYLLILEGLRQLSFQFPEHTPMFTEVRNHIRRIFNYRIQLKNSVRTERSLLYNLFSTYHEVIEKTDRPVLAVFDSFEEMEYRITNEELENIFHLLEEISSRIPRIRFVFAGRSESWFQGRNFEHLHIREFDRESAFAVMKQMGISDKTLMELIYKKVGGNPLTLKLAAELVRRSAASAATKTIQSLDTTSWMLMKLDERLIQGQLVERNLNHIHDDDVRKIAYPGMLVRRLTPGIILHVLAEPCGLGAVTAERAVTLFEHVARETFLVNREQQALVFRPDLRAALLPMVAQKDPSRTTLIHQSAITYYSQRDDAASRAELLYHQLKCGASTRLIDELYDDDVSLYFDNCITELEERYQLYFSKIKGGLISSTGIHARSADSNASYLEARAAQALENGDETSLIKIDGELKKQQQISDLNLLSEMGLVQFRLGDRHGLVATMDAIRAHPETSQLPFQYLRLGVYAAEYDMNFSDAYHLISAIKAPPRKNFRLLFEYLMTKSRLAARIGRRAEAVAHLREAEILLLSQIQKKDASANHGIGANTPAHPFLKKRAWINVIPTRILRTLAITFLQEQGYAKAVEKLRARFPDRNRLEKFLFREEKLFSSDLFLACTYEVLLHDVVLMLELQRKENLLIPTKPKFKK